MAYFTQAQPGSTLFLGQSNAGVGYVAAVFPALPPETAYEIPDVLGITAAGAPLDASLIFLQEPIGSDVASQSAFVANVASLIAAQPNNAERIIAWSASPAPLSATDLATMGPGNTSGVLLSSTLSFYDVSSNVRIVVSGQQKLQADDTGISISWQQGVQAIQFTGLNATSYSPLTIPFSGANAFCIQLTISMMQTALDVRQLGFAFATAPPPPAPVSTPEQLLYAPLATPDARQTPIFTASFDPLDLVNAFNPDRTMLAFSGRNVETTVTQFYSCYTSPSGTPITLVPITPTTALSGDVASRLVFVSLEYRNSTPAIFMLVPEGDFALGIASGSTPQIMCGLQGMEYLTFTPTVGKVAGDRLRFVANQPAYAAQFPFPLASPTAAPFDPTASQLTSQWTTSYATLRQPVGGDATPVALVAQPPGFQLFGQGGTVNPTTHPALLGSMAPVSPINASPTHAFPLVPYQRVASAGPTTMSAQQVSAFEAGVLSPMRSAALAQDAIAPTGDTTTWFVTRSGYLVEALTDGATGTAIWQQILLGNVNGQNIAFDKPDQALVQAFGSGSLMLVIANAVNLGTFENTLTIDGWTMEANVAEPDTFGDYANIVIVKAMPGALSDLIANPAGWTNPATFASPITTTGTQGVPDSGQLVNVSQWLQDYFAAAAAVTGPDATYFAEFNTIATDPNWTGALILKADITAIPTDIEGLLAGIKDYTNFNVHHLALPVVPASVPIAPQPSPVSGLIYYNPYPGDPTAAVATDPSATYGFQLNSLKVTFQNSAVQTFSSYAQITLRNVFGSDVISSDAGFDAIVLAGTYQLIDSQPVYSMASTTETTLTLDCAVLPRVDVTGVQMSTITADPNGNTVSAFALVGYLDFALLPGAVTNPDGVVDLFSFGRDTGSTVPAGLAFQNLVLTMTFPTPADPGTPVVSTFSLASSALRFDLGTSQIRSGSLVASLSLEVTSLLQSTSTPKELGYLPVIAMIPGGKLGQSWNALTFNLDLGTPGQLAAKAGLTASLLLAWNPASNKAGTWDVQIGLQLPGTSQGAPLISIQTVLSLSVGQVSLQYALTSDGKSQAFLLMLNEIALSFLGFLKFPPNGATSFYLFGSPGTSDLQTSLGWYAQYVNAGDNS